MTGDKFSEVVKLDGVIITNKLAVGEDALTTEVTHGGVPSAENGGSEKQESWDESNRKVTQMGFLGWRPRFMERFNTPSYFLAIFAMGNVFMVMSSGTLSVIIPTLESLFNLSSKQTGLILMGSDISGMIAGVFIANYCSTRKIRWIGLGMIVCAIASLIPSSVHFTAEYPQPSSINSRSTDVVLGRVQDNSDLCSETANVFQQESNDDDDSLYASNNHKYYWLFVLGAILQGIGTSPPLVAGETYIDEIFTQKQFGIAITVLYVISFIGHPVAIILGGVFLKLYATLHAPEGVTPDSKEWVGAWWIGMFFASFAILFFSFFVMLYPRQMPAAKEVLKEKAKRGITSVAEKKKELGRSLLDLTKDMMPGCLRLLKNKAFVCLILGDIFLFLQIGSFAYTPKMYSIIYRLKPADVGLAVGAATVVGIAVGLAAAGAVIAPRNWSPRKLQFVYSVLVLLSTPCILGPLLYCPVNTYAGVDVPYSPNSKQLSSLSLIDTCNTDCGCTTAFYQPVCDGDITYFSPCHAGCRDVITKDSMIAQYTNCACTASHTAQPGDCGDPCSPKLYLALITMVVERGLKIAAFAAHAVVYQRIVSETDRTLAQGVRNSFTRALGTLPAPFIFGALFDTTCQVWRGEGEGEQGNCWIYDIERFMGWNRAILVILSVLCAGCGFLCCYFYPSTPVQDTRTISLRKLEDEDKDTVNEACKQFEYRTSV